MITKGKPMTNQSDAQREGQNIKAVVEYLEKEFDQFTVTVDSDGARIDRIFTVRERTTVYKLQVARPRLTDREYTPEKIKKLLKRDRVSKKMIEMNGQIFMWGR